ncbi:hypothetical protein C0J52_23772 [Blattella germanica]|nr:hypothetical protein C0J52_23772 [Blattella germanica]
MSRPEFDFHLETNFQEMETTSMNVHPGLQQFPRRQSRPSFSRLGHPNSGGRPDEANNVFGPNVQEGLPPTSNSQRPEEVNTFFGTSTQEGRSEPRKISFNMSESTGSNYYVPKAPEFRK